MRCAHPRGLLASARRALARRNAPLARFVALAMRAEFDSPCLFCWQNKTTWEFSQVVALMVEARRIELRSILDSPRGPTSLSNDLNSKAKRPLAGFSAI